jgi:hypothetical protein
MSDMILWGAGFALELCILIRGLRTRMVARYPYFYFYIFCVAAGSVALYAMLPVKSPLYRKYYWPIELVTAVAGCAVVLEILTLALASYLGAARFLRRLCLVVLGAVICYGWGRAALGGLGTAVRTERDLRLIEALFLAAMLVVVSFYGVRLGRNLKGLIFGFGSYIGVSLMASAAYAVFGSRFFIVNSYLQTGTYLCALVVWTLALWSYAPNPVPENEGPVAPDYEDLALETRERLREISDQLKGTARP